MIRWKETPTDMRANAAGMMLTLSPSEGDRAWLFEAAFRIGEFTFEVSRWSRTRKVLMSPDAAKAWANECLAELSEIC